MVRARHLVVQGPRRQDQQPRRLDPGPRERPEPDPPRPRVPPGARHRGGQEGTRQPRHRQRPARLRWPRSSRSTRASRSATMFGIVTTFHGINIEKTPQQTLPVIVLSSLNYYYQGYDYGNVELTSQPNDLQVITSFLGVGVRQRHHDGQAPAGAGDRSPCRCSTARARPVRPDRPASALQALGLRHRGPGGRRRPAASLSETTVYYSSPATSPRPSRCCTRCRGRSTLGIGPTSNGADVTVVTGSNFSVERPGLAQTSRARRHLARRARPAPASTSPWRRSARPPRPPRRWRRSTRGPAPHRVARGPERPSGAGPPASIPPRSQAGGSGTTLSRG